MPTSEYEKTRKAADRVDDMIGFYIHLLVYFLVIAMLILVNYRSDDEWWVQWPMIGWGIGLLMHGLAVNGRMPRALVAWRLRMIDRLRSS